MLKAGPTGLSTTFFSSSSRLKGLGDGVVLPLGVVGRLNTHGDVKIAAKPEGDRGGSIAKKRVIFSNLD